ncbi:MAG: ArsA family ATPase [Candidatus Hodarchaeales archaeon]|jgi:arsenite-transporting ATPase
MSDYAIVSEGRRFIFFGGKGGVGKTTMAAATAVYAAEQGIETLILSTDPAHSLSDSLDQRIGGEIIKVAGIETDCLYALELDPEKAVSDFGEVMAAQDSAGALGEILGEDDILSMSPPGVDETVAFSKVLEFIEKSPYELVIFDTAPTGHTLRLLSLPEVMDSWLWKIISMRHRLSSTFGGIKRAFFGGKDDGADESVKALKEMRERVKVARTHLANPTETSFVVVTIPALMAIYETERLIRALYEYEIPTKHILVNQIPPENPSCQFCASRSQMAMENLEKIQLLYEDFVQIEIPTFEHEIRGVDALRELGEGLHSESPSQPNGDASS